ncbi:gfo/Idh/MocA family oxidoreductase [Sesbania bispinosa]|nr:gfo/Idh/MocA family oxidoreductase [Sesbania bispinosa]
MEEAKAKQGCCSLTPDFTKLIAATESLSSQIKSSPLSVDKETTSLKAQAQP